MKNRLIARGEPKKSSLILWGVASSQPWLDLTSKDLCFKLVKSRNQEMALFNGDFDWFVSGFWPFDLENHGFVICDFPRRIFPGYVHLPFRFMHGICRNRLQETINGNVKTIKGQYCPQILHLVGGLEHFLFFHSVRNNNPNWLIFFRMVETTNQACFCFFFWGSSL